MNRPPLLIEVRDHVALLTLNRPAKRNALSGELRRSLSDTLPDAASDEAVRVAVLTGAGRAFCAGLDLAEIAASGRSVEDNVADENVIAAIAAFPEPIIGAINGVAVTVGFEIAVALDIWPVGEGAGFVDSHVAVGVAAGGCRSDCRALSACRAPTSCRCPDGAYRRRGGCRGTSGEPRGRSRSGNRRLCAAARRRSALALGSTASDFPGEPRIYGVKVSFRT